MGFEVNGRDEPRKPRGASRHARFDSNSVLDSLTKLAAERFGVPLAYVALADEEGVWFPSAHGMPPHVLPDGPGLCQRIFETGGSYHLSDAAEDSRAKENPAVRSGVRFYAGAPLRVSSGDVVGTFCVMGLEERAWTSEEEEVLADFASLAHSELERCRLESELVRLEKGLRHVQKLESLGILAGGIAHDFNNLLVGILGHAGLVLSELPRTSPYFESLKTIENAAERASELTSQMLAYSGKGEFVVEAIDLSQVVRGTCDLLEVAVTKRAVVHYEFATEPVHVQGDLTQLRQVLMNLVTNASDALGDTGGSIRISTGIVEASEEFLARGSLAEKLVPGKYAYLEVEDTGRGIGARTLERIFEAFFTTKIKGRGLGLANVRGIVRGHQGAVWVESDVGRGSTFRILLPPSGAVARTEKADEPGGADWHGSGKILVVDDEPVVLSFARRSLEHAGFDVVTALDGEEGVRTFSEQASEISGVLLDVVMPRKDGEAAYKEMRAIRADVPIVFTSGYNVECLEGRVAERPVYFLKKPYLPGKLIETLREALGV